jgi:hypothetical protein
MASVKLAEVGADFDGAQPDAMSRARALTEGEMNFSENLPAGLMDAPSSQRLVDSA